jgi:DNA-binding Lrp family transcriptional regulator
MVQALVLISAEPGRDREVAKKLKGLAEVKQVYLVSGVFDVVAEIQAADAAGILALVYDKIRPIDDIRETQTMFCLKV